SADSCEPGASFLRVDAFTTGDGGRRSLVQNRRRRAHPDLGRITRRTLANGANEYLGMGPDARLVGTGSDGFPNVACQPAAGITVRRGNGATTGASISGGESRHPNHLRDSSRKPAADDR